MARALILVLGIAGCSAAGANYTCAVLATGAARCWGYNRFGQLGLGHTEDIGDDETPRVRG